MSQFPTRRYPLRLKGTSKRFSPHLIASAPNVSVSSRSSTPTSMRTVRVTSSPPDPLPRPHPSPPQQYQTSLRRLQRDLQSVNHLAQVVSRLGLVTSTREAASVVEAAKLVLTKIARTAQRLAACDRRRKEMAIAQLSLWATASLAPLALCSAAMECFFFV